MSEEEDWEVASIGDTVDEDAVNIWGSGLPPSLGTSSATLFGGVHHHPHNFPLHTLPTLPTLPTEYVGLEEWEMRDNASRRYTHRNRNYPPPPEVLMEEEWEEEMRRESESASLSCELKEINATEVTKKVEDLLQCPVCLAVPIPPIWNCMNGHIVCSQCKPQMRNCGVCRASFSSGRNLFMEEIVGEVGLTCPYEGKGCTQIVKGKMIMEHVKECSFGPKFKWILMQRGRNDPLPANLVEAGFQKGVKLFVIRAKHMDSKTPGKLYERVPQGCCPVRPRASLAWGGAEHFKEICEVLVAPPNTLKWIPAQDGVKVPNAVIGGYSEDAGEVLYIGRYLYQGELINGKIQPSHHCCYIGVNGVEKASTTYEILVEITDPVNTGTGSNNDKDNATSNGRKPGGTGSSSTP